MRPYHSIPELGIIGRRSARSRLRGIDFLESKVENKTVLDLGCAEGLISLQLACNGASLIHGIERNEDSIAIAERLFEKYREAFSDGIEFHFLVSDFGNWANFTNSCDLLMDKYDVVLALGVWHNLKADDALNIWKGLEPFCSEWVAFRGGIVRHAAVREQLQEDGFKLVKKVAPTLWHNWKNPLSGRPDPLLYFQRRHSL